MFLVDSPSIKTSPTKSVSSSKCGIIPFINLVNDVLPEPLSPISSTHSPFSTFKLISFNILYPVLEVQDTSFILT